MIGGWQTGGAGVGLGTDGAGELLQRLPAAENAKRGR